MTAVRAPDTLTRRFFWIAVAGGLPFMVLLAGLGWYAAVLARDAALNSHRWALVSRRAGIEQLADAANEHVAVMRSMLEQSLAGKRDKALSVPATLDPLPDSGLSTGRVFSPPAALNTPEKRSDAASAASLFPLLAAVHQSKPYFRWSYVFDASKAFVAMYPWGPNAVFLGDPREELRSYQAWFDYDVFQDVTPARNPMGAAVWTPVYADAARTGLMVSHVAPVYVGGQFRAMVGADVLVSYLSSYLDGFPAIDGRFVILDQAGAVVAASGGFAASGSEVVRGAAVLDGASLPSAESRFEGGERSFIAWSPIAGTPWRLVHTVPRAAVFGATLSNVAPYLAIGTGLLLSFAALYFALRGQFVRPATRLAAFVEQAAGEGAPALPRLPSPWRPWAGRIAAAIGAQRDLMTKVREAEHLKTAVIDAVLDGVVIADEKGVIIGFNAGAERIFGLSAGAALGRSVGDVIVPPAMRRAHEAGMARFSATREPHVLGRKLEMEALRADGSVFPVELAIQHVEADGGAVFAAYIRDLSDVRAAQAEVERKREQLHQMEKLSAMGSLLAGVAHELNNPLAIVVAQSMLLSAKADTPDVKRRASRIQAAAERCGRIVKSFLAMARQAAERREAVDLNRLVESASEMVAYGRKSAGIALHLDLDPGLPPISADPDMLGQVVANLLINAAQALEQARLGKDIWVATAVADNRVCLTVADNGPGVPPAIRDRIFEPYFTTKPAGVGTGIGLSITRKVVEGHGGTIAVGTREGGGASFRIMLPLTNAHAGLLGAQPKPTEHAHRILVADDEPEVARSLAEMLSDLGHEVATVDGGEAALRRLERERFDFVFADLRMPGLGGASLKAALRERDPDLAYRTIIVTGDITADAAMSAAGSSGTVMLEKPFTPADVVAALVKASSASAPAL